MEETEETSAAAALSTIISALNRLDPDERARVLNAVSTFFGVRAAEPSAIQPTPQKAAGLRDLGFTQDYTPSPKEFLIQKQPHTDVERVACLSYYLTHYRQTPYFKTLDLSKLNTEAAQPKFANAAYASNNALKMGYLASAEKGQRQLSAAGELFVAALPDRDAARAAMSSARRRRLIHKKRDKAGGDMGEQ